LIEVNDSSETTRALFRCAFAVPPVQSEPLSPGSTSVDNHHHAVRARGSRSYMLPIQKLLSRIRWDPRFRRGRFALGYFDRVTRGIVVVPFDTIRFPAEAPGTFEIWDEEGVLHRIPFHRVRRVYRNGRLIWERHPPGESPGS